MNFFKSGIFRPGIGIFENLRIRILGIGDFFKSSDFHPRGFWISGDFYPEDKGFFKIWRFMSNSRIEGFSGIFGDGNFSRLGIFAFILFWAGCDSRTELTFEPTVKILENHSKLRNLR